MPRAGPIVPACNCARCHQLSSNVSTALCHRSLRLLWPAAVLLATLLLTTGLHAQPLPELHAYTEEWPPYNYSERNGELKGIATEALRAACHEAGLHCKIESVPWARAYAWAQSKPNTLVYTTARKPEREQQFIWIGPLLPRSTWVFVRADALKQHGDSRDLKAYRYGVVRGEAAAQDLAAAGVPATAILSDSSNAAVLKLLQGGWVDAMVDTEIGMAWSQRNAGGLELTRLAKLSDEGAYYFALNPKSDPALADKLSAALEQLRKAGSIDEIVRRYTR